MRNSLNEKNSDKADGITMKNKSPNIKKTSHTFLHYHTILLTSNSYQPNIESSCNVISSQCSNYKIEQSHSSLKSRGNREWPLDTNPTYSYTLDSLCTQNTTVEDSLGHVHCSQAHKRCNQNYPSCMSQNTL